MIQCFSLTTKQHQPAYKPQKRSNEQEVGTNFDIRVELVSHKGLLAELLRIES